MLSSSEARLLSAELRGDEPLWNRLRDIDRSRGGWFQVMPVAFALAARRRFGEYPDLRTVALFVRRFLDRSPNADEFSARNLEAMIRGVTGEEHLIPAVGPAAAGPIMYALLFALVDDLELDDREADELLASAEQVVDLANQSADAPGGSADAPAFDFDMHRRTRRAYLSDDDLRPPQSAKPSRSKRGAAKPGKKKRWGRQSAASLRPSTVAGQYLSASMLRRSEVTTRLMVILRRLDNGDIGRMVSAAFAIAVPREFPGADLREAAAVAVEIRKAVKDQVDLMKIEFLIRHALGEDVPIDDIHPNEQLASRMLVLAAFADFWNRDEAAVDALIAEAEANLAEAGIPLSVSES